MLENVLICRIKEDIMRKGHSFLGEIIVLEEDTLRRKICLIFLSICRSVVYIKGKIVVYFNMVA